MDRSQSSRRLWFELLNQAIAIGGLIWSLKMCMKYLDPYKEQREQSRKRALFIKEQLGRSLELNEFEQLLASNVMNPAHIDVTVEDVHGLEPIINELEMKVLYPLKMPDLYSTTLWRQTRGVLLYGPPGTGKTMLVKALAKASGCFFLNITSSSIMSKWLGDASRLVRAIFSLAEKLQPCIIFIDEVDSMLGRRGMGQEHEATLQVKTEFMQMWDGMESNRGQRIVVMGATNRPSMIDEAVLRRFSTQYEIGLPTEDQRRSIIRGYVKRHMAEVGEGGVSPALVLNLPDEDSEGLGAVDWIAHHTEGFSGSDLTELSSQAAQRVLAEYWEQHRNVAPQRKNEVEVGEPIVVRAVTRKDFEETLKAVRPATAKAEEYENKVAAEAGGMGNINMFELMKLMAAMMSTQNPGGSK